MKLVIYFFIQSKYQARRRFGVCMMSLVVCEVLVQDMTWNRHDTLSWSPGECASRDRSYQFICGSKGKEVSKCISG